MHRFFLILADEINTVVTYTPGTTERIAVTNGDMIGWFVFYLQCVH